MKTQNILDEIPEKARLALTRQAIREGRSIADLIGEIALQAADRILAEPATEPPHETRSRPRGANGTGEENPESGFQQPVS